MSRSIPAGALACPALLVSALAADGSGQVHFTDVAPATGAYQVAYGRGAAWADFDGDGLLDFVTANAGMNVGVFRQKPDGTFEDAHALWGFADDVRSHWCVIAADLDNDGDPDLYFGNGGFTGAQANQVLRNDLAMAGGFTDVSDSSGDGDYSKATFGGTSLDYDRDGLLDLFLSNRLNQGCTLLRNLGGLVFQDVSAAAGIAETGGDYRHCSAGDINNDGWIDVGVGNNAGDNLVYRNKRDGTFQEVAVLVGLAAPMRSFGLVFDDFDNDGWMDAYVPKYNPTPPETSRLFANRGDGTFRDVSAGSGIGRQTDMGHNVGDVDGDGFPDIYIGTGHPLFESYDFLHLVTPDGLGGLLCNDVSVASGILANGKTRSHGSAFADFDRDGDLDFYVNNGGPEDDPTTIEESFLWSNDGNENAWLEVDLAGVLSNRSAVGARAQARGASGRIVHRFLGAGKGFGNTDAATLHFGLGAETRLAELLVTWPSGITQRLLDPAIRTRFELIETGLRVTGDATPGSTLTLDACGPASERLHLFVALSTASIELAPLGILEVLPPLIEIVIEDLDPTGRATLGLDVPNDPALIDQTFFLQGWIVPPDMSAPGLLTNRLDVTVE